MPAEMAKLYFKYGAMGSSKTATALITKYNYEERGMRVLIMKPSIDTKGGEKLMSRLGVERRVDIAVRPDMDPLALVRADIAKNGPLACVLTDESQFFTSWQAEQLFMVTVALNVPVICLSQLSRANEKREDKRPMLSDLRESGAIEQDADIVMFLYRDDYYNENTEKPGVCEVNIAKHRSGPTDKIELTWVARYTKFSDKAL